MCPLSFQDDAEPSRACCLPQARRRREQDKGGAVSEQEGVTKPRRPGDPGFRWHASIPEPARLDYVRRPESQVALDVSKARRAPEGTLDKRLKAINRPGRAGQARAAKVSVEGRGL